MVLRFLVLFADTFEIKLGKVNKKLLRLLCILDNIITR